MREKKPGLPRAEAETKKSPGFSNSARGLLGSDRGASGSSAGRSEITVNSGQTVNEVTTQSRGCSREAWRRSEEGDGAQALRHCGAQSSLALLCKREHVCLLNADIKESRF